MSRQLVPRPAVSDTEKSGTQATPKPKKISTACGACKQRKTKCSGTLPCEACASRDSPCVYDASSDQRRKIAAQRTLQELSDVNQNLEKHQQLLGGIIAILRTPSDAAANDDLVATIRSGVDLSQLGAHVRNARRANALIETEFSKISFFIDGDEDLPSATQLLASQSDSGLASRASISSSGGNLEMPYFNAFPPLDRNPERRS